jgi:radical SAM superfamily enzyme with C-terminal helix-hairpin-helix motif
LKWLPGVSAKSATKLLSKMPFRNAEEFEKAVPGASVIVEQMDFS